MRVSERKEGKRGFWKRPFVIGAVSVVGVVAGVATIVDVFSEAGVWKAIGNGIAVAWKAVVGFMTLSTPVWAFFLLLLVTPFSEQSSQLKSMPLPTGEEKKPRQGCLMS